MNDHTFTRSAAYYTLWFVISVLSIPVFGIGLAVLAYVIYDLKSFSITVTSGSRPAMSVNTGLLWCSRDVTKLHDIVRVDDHTGPLYALLGFGTLTVWTCDGNNRVFHGIHNVRSLAAILRQQ